MKNLYKTTSNGLTQFWRQEISEDGKSYRTVTGKLDGKEVHSAWMQPTIKNVGKVNETSVEQQVLKEVESNYTIKMNQGNYKESLDDAGKDNYFKPMLAKKYSDDYTPTLNDYKKGIIFSQPKLDGVRCIITIDGMWSRQGKPILSAPHIYDQVKHLFDIDPDLILDGELYNHELKHDFDSIISLVRKTKPTEADIIESEQKIEYWVYDIHSTEPFGIRRLMLEHLLKDGYSKLKLVPSIKVFSQDELDVVYGTYLEDGYEGQMVRISSKEYENKRSKQLLKRKEFVDEEFVIHDILEGVGNRSGMAGRIEYVLSDGRVVGAGVRGGFDLYKKLLLDKDDYVGTLVTIRYQNLTPDGVPRFAVATKFWGSYERNM